AAWRIRSVRGRQLQHLLEERDPAGAAALRLRGRVSPESHDHVGSREASDLPLLARLRPGDRAGTTVRFSSPRAVRARTWTAIRPDEAAARPVRARDRGSETL